MNDDPLIFAGCDVKMPKANPDSTTGSTDRDNAPLPEVTDQEIALMFHGVWRRRVVPVG